MRRSRFGAAIALGAVVCLAIASDAAACHNAITISTDAVARQLRNADELVRTGRSVDALGVVDSALYLLRHGHSRGGGTELDADLRSRRVRLLRERGERIIAIIVVRRDGAVDRTRMRAPSRVSAAQRTENLAWALERLTPAAGEDSPEIRARYAEALAKHANRREEARAILIALADADVMPDAWGYRTLAELSDRNGDLARRDASIAACQARAGDAVSYVCPRLIAVR